VGKVARVQYSIGPQEVDESAGLTRLFDRDSGCETFTQRVLSFTEPTGERRDEGADEVLYVLAGAGDVVAGEARRKVRPGAAVFVAAGCPWRVDRVDAGPLRILSVLVLDPAPALRREAYVDAEGASPLGATAGRDFRLALTPDDGCATVTQFVGRIPPGRAPDHFHTYDEVIYVLEGTGTLHIGGETAPLEPAAAVHLPARLVHSLENTGPDDMLLLGVFRPAGSPAEAYYPDGTPAAVPEVA
jgi:mannose-6-phosphate isomerase-like protein (cupin superfamily)